MKLIAKMQRRGLMGLLYLLLIAALVLPQIAGVSAWSGDPTVNTAICTAAHLQRQPQIVSDGAGGAIITWYDQRSGSGGPIPEIYADIYVQRVNSSGAVLWTANGSAICTVTREQYIPKIVSDGAGGAIITWCDYRNSGDQSNPDIYAQRVNSSGAALWAPNGVPICTASAVQTEPQLVSDGAGGAIITWYDERGGIADIYAQRVNSSGAVQWTDNGVPICTASLQQYYPQIVSDGAGGAIITWQDQRSGPADIYAQRVNSGGIVQWTANGVPICTLSNEQDNPHLVSDDSGGAIITWNDERNGGPQQDIYAQRVNSSGAVLWTVNGVSICAASGYQNDPQIISDGSGGGIITWEDYRSGDADIYTQKVGSGGASQWTANGSAICTALGGQSWPQLVSDGSGGGIITWEDYRNGHDDIYAQKVNSGGASQWTANGSAICTALGGQSYPQIVSDGSGGAIITWEDYRNGNADIYAQGVASSGNLATTPTSPKASSQTRLASSHRTSNYGQSVTFTATVRAHRGKSTTLTGTVTFKDGATIIASDVPLVGNKATFTTTALTLGSHTITAVYNGDDNFSGSTSSRFNQRVRQARHSTGVTLSINP